ncbi:MAG: hypothetical protein QHI48_10155 [Bacteroidota bacterium]|nr:hypothetical protein [Bacteroidota bacterium]
MSKPTFESDWEGFKGHVALKWDRLSNEELLRIEGNFENLVNLIVEKYGETKEAVEKALNELYRSFRERKDELAGRTQEIAETVKSKARELKDEARETIQRIREQKIEPAVRKSEDYIKLHPFTAVLGALGVGILIGSLLGLRGRKDE